MPSILKFFDEALAHWGEWREWLDALHDDDLSFADRDWLKSVNLLSAGLLSYE
jgi:hypothetical protein